MNLELAGDRVTVVAGLGDHPLLEDYRGLREADLSRRRGAFIAESEVVLGVLLRRSRFRVRSVLLARPRLAKLAPLLASADPVPPVFVAEQQVLDQIVGFHIHRGVLAAGERTAVPSPAEQLATFGSGPVTVVVLEGLTNHDNVGGVFRNAAAFGVDAVFYDEATCDPLYRKAIRVSVGGSLVVPFARAPSTADILPALRSAGFTTLALSPRRDATDVTEVGRDRALPARIALVLGSEGPGLRDETMQDADRVVRIGIVEHFDSLNVATTSGIVLHALAAARR